MDKKEIFEILKQALIELFEINESKITMEARIYEELEIDSIDAIDLMLYIKQKTGFQMEASDFNEVRTLGHIVDIVAQKINEKNT